MNFASLVLLSSIEHANLKVKPVNGYSFARSNHLVSLVLHELPRASTHYPVVFVKRQNSESFMPMALLGVEPGKNLFVDEKGQWLESAYVPAAFRRYPFALAQTEPDSMAVCFDGQSEFLSGDEGLALFDEQGRPSEALEKIKSFLIETHRSELAAETFCAKLVQLNLLTPAGFEVRSPDGVRHYSGSFVVDEQKLAALSPEDFLNLREQGHLAGIYAHLISLLHIDRFGLLRSRAG